MILNIKTLYAEEAREHIGIRRWKSSLWPFVGSSSRVIQVSGKVYILLLLLQTLEQLHQEQEATKLKKGTNRTIIVAAKVIGFPGFVNNLIFEE